jgi:predicted Fe-Mo cluster-binding NifX family protein
MKIALPVEEKILNTPVCVSFGRTPLFVIFDTENGEFEFIDNSAAASQGGAGIKAAQILVDKGAKAVITFRCGENAAAVLKPTEITLYKAVDGTAFDNIEKFRLGELSLLNDIHPGFHNHGGKE